MKAGKTTEKEIKRVPPSLRNPWKKIEQDIYDPSQLNKKQMLPALASSQTSTSSDSLSPVCRATNRWPLRSSPAAGCHVHTWHVASWHLTWPLIRDFQVRSRTLESRWLASAKRKKANKRMGMAKNKTWMLEHDHIRWGPHFVYNVAGFGPSTEFFNSIVQ